MAIDVNWSDDKKILLRVHIHGTVSWDQYHAMCNEAYAMMTTVPHLVDIIFTAEIDVPSGNPLPHFKRAAIQFQAAGNLDCCISVVPINIPLARVFSSLMYRIYGIHKKFQNAYSMEEALQMIAEERAKQIPPA